MVRSTASSSSSSVGYAGILYAIGADVAQLVSKLQVLRLYMVRGVNRSRTAHPLLAMHPKLLTFLLSAALQGDPQVGIGVAGDTNVSLSFEGRTAGGLAASRRASFLAAPGKAPRQFQVYPVVESVRPATGSTAGGRLVTIVGKGFPSSSMPGNNAITQLLVGGVPCQVVASNFTSISCRTQPQPDTAQAAVMACSASSMANDTSDSTAASNTTSNSSSSSAGQSYSDGSIRGLFPGMRGVLYEQFNR
jgi:hypothetical protein